MSGPARDTDIEALLALVRNGKAKEASRQAMRSLKRTPGDPALLFVAGLADHACGHERKGITKLRRATLAAPESVAIALNLGIMLVEKGDYPEAMEHLERAHVLQPDDPAILAQLGQCQLRAGAFGRARASLERAIVLAGTDPGLVRLCGLACRLDGDLANAARLFAQAFSIDGRDGDIAVELGITLSMAGDMAGAERAYRAAIDVQPTNSRAYRQLGNLLTKTGQFEAAVGVNKRALGLSAGDLGVTYDLAHAMASSARPGEALDLLDPLIENGQAPPDLAELAAFAAFRDGDHQGCIDRCDAILSRAPSRTAAIAYKAMALNEIGHRSAAAGIFALDRLVTWEIAEAPEPYTTLDAFNAALIEEIENHPSLAYSPLNRSLMRGRGTGELFDAPTGAIAALQTVVNSAVARWRARTPVDPTHPWLSQRPGQTRTGCWANIMDQGGFHDVHFHPPGWLSGVYYPAVPAEIGDGESGHEGWIEFGRSYYMLKSSDKPPVRLLRPLPGMIVLFPSYIGHRTLPFAADCKRISVAFDVMPSSGSAANT